MVCAISTLFVNDVRYYFPTFNDRILGPLSDNKSLLPAFLYY